MLNRFFVVLMVLLVSQQGLTAANIENDSVSFEKDVRPILKEHCFHCHGESGEKEAELDLRLRRFIVAGGDSGPAIEIGKPEQSLLLQRVTSGDMPPGDKELSSHEVELLSAWILGGASTLREEPESLGDGEYFTEEERNYWAFQRVSHAQPPSHPDATVDNPVDAFVLAKLKDHGLTFSKQADRATLIRRATFDLWGLPPDPAMVEAFIRDDHPLAYERLIDRLLASPRYGERWARHWLDVAGYADSDGYTDRDTVREFAYFYRDYVIDSFNANKPLDVFICEQLAGDEMGTNGTELSRQRISQLAATGFLRMAPDGTSDGSVERDVAANETVAGTLEIVSTSLLGMTVGCARCHDHRYDPISQADYYRFRAIFEPALDWKSWKVPNQRRISLYTDQDRSARDAVEKKAKEAEAARTERQREHIDRTLEEELLVVPDEVRESLRTAFRTSKQDRSVEQVALLEEYPSVGNISNGSLYLYAEQRARRSNDILQAASERESRYVRELQAKRIADLPQPIRDQLEALIDVPVDKRTDAQKQLAARHAHALPGPESLETLWPEKYAEIQRYREAARICKTEDAKTELANMQKEIVAIRATAPKERFLRVLSEPADHQPATNLFIRGDHKQPGQTLPPAEITVLRHDSVAPFPLNDPALSTSGRRLAYARQLTSGEHPLLARVLVNRVWMQHFGRGIVDTPGDFGRLGSRPTHPELLDWLASDLVQSGWDLKQLHRRLMLSQVYGQTSKRSGKLDDVDPDNRLYARMSVRRLESEAVRDSILSVSGSMVHRMHGPPIPVKEDGVGQIVLGVEMLDGERKPTGSDGEFEGMGRRSIYVQVRRTRPLAVLESFDIPANSPNCTVRNHSNVATQSLMMMNSEFTIRFAEKLAKDLIRRYPDSEQQLSVAWKRCFSRDIDAASLDEVTRFMESQTTAIKRRNEKIASAEAHRLALASACQAMLSSNGFLYVD